MTTPVCTVDGEQVSELAVLIKPVAFLVTTEFGTHELTRVYFQGGKFAVGVDLQRLGELSLKSAQLSTESSGGLRLYFDKGYKMYLPLGHCQATWRE